MTVQQLRVPPPYHGWLASTYDEFPNKKNFVEPTWRNPRSPKMLMTHPYLSNYNQSPGAPNNPLKEEIYQYHKQKSYLDWNPPKHKETVDPKIYDEVEKYDITKH
jgi:NADH:ubiquinone oxidoreductase subunit